MANSSVILADGRLRTAGWLYSNFSAGPTQLPIPGIMNRLCIRIEFDSSGGGMGPTLALLLDRVRERGSIRKAAASLGMGYGHAWRLIQRLQDTFRAQIVATATGGVAGGGTELTALGTELLASYRRIEERAGSATRADMSQLSGMLRS